VGKTMNQKPEPLYAPPRRNQCPVCGDVSYSPDGIHPQCAMQKADQERMTRIKSPSTAAKKKIARDADVKPWQKSCPKCQALMHVRKKFCDCGHGFPNSGDR